MAGLVCGFALVQQPVRAETTAWENDVRVAQAQGRWDDVVRLYQDELGRTPGRGDIWVKMADVEYARGILKAVVPILE